MKVACPFAERLFQANDNLTLMLSEGNLMGTCKFHKTFTQKYMSNSENWGFSENTASCFCRNFAARK